MIWYFCKDFKHLLRVKMEQYGQKLDSFKEIVEKRVDAKTKVALRPHCYNCNIDQYYLQSCWLSATKTSIQGQWIKGAKVDRPKSRPKSQKYQLFGILKMLKTLKRLRKRRRKRNQINKTEKKRLRTLLRQLKLI